MLRWDVAILFGLALVLLIIAHAFYSSSNLHLSDANDLETTAVTDIISQPESIPGRFNQECSEPPAYIFLKKHKTASTTFRQLMSHYSKYKGLVGESQMMGPQGGCYPARFNEKCWPALGFYLSKRLSDTEIFR